MVIKRDGTKKEFDIQKIRKQLDLAFHGTSLNVLRFEAQLQFDTRHMIKTSEIQEQLILTAKNNVSAQEPEWLIVSGRLSAYQLFREVWKNTRIDFSGFKDHIKYLERNGYYRNDMICKFTEKEINTLSKYIKEDRDMNLILSQVMLLKGKYLIKNKKGPLEYPSTADMFNSMILSSNEKDKVKYSKEYYDLFSRYVLSPGTPFKSNLRIPNGNTGSCFVGESGDSLNQLFKGYTDKAVISKEGGGIGWYFGKVRPGGSYSKRVPKANEINKWLKIVNDIAVAVNQRGIRKGAITPAIDWWHMDIVSFIELKSELNGDLRDKCFDIFPQVVVDKYFIDRVLEDGYVNMFDQYEYKELSGLDITELIGDELYAAQLQVEEFIESGKLKHYTRMKAKDLWKKFLEVWIEYGDFYISHKDNINMSNYISEFGIAKCVNLCTESFSFSKATTKWVSSGNKDEVNTIETDGYTHSCNLTSINVGNILNNEKLLKRACYAAVRMLDTSIDLGTMPVAEALKSAQFIRNIGVGVVGMADWMAHNGHVYDTESGRKAGEILFEKIAYYCYNASIDLAVEKGSYPGIKHANYSTIFGKDPKVLNEMSRANGNNFDWVKVQRDIIEKGIRNMLILSPAPNTSSGLLQGVTASYLPAHSKDSTQKLGDMVVPILPKYIKTKMWGYKTKFQYKAEDLIKFTKYCQRWVDTGMSMEVPINSENTTIKAISDEILSGFDSGETKAVYYSLTVDGNKIGCDGCAN